MDTPAILSHNETRALSLLVAGCTQVQVASALGVTESAITQMLSREEFARQVMEGRIKQLTSQTERDRKYDSLEDTLLEKLEASVGMLYKPTEITRTLQAINAAKRRGLDSPATSQSSTVQVVTITLPTQIVQQFTTNINNQVIQAGSQSLLTMQSSALAERVKNGHARLIEKDSAEGPRQEAF
jgi:predicted transcriptional regulator